MCVVGGGVVEAWVVVVAPSTHGVVGPGPASPAPGHAAAPRDVFRGVVVAGVGPAGSSRGWEVLDAAHLAAQLLVDLQFLLPELLDFLERKKYISDIWGKKRMYS